MMSYNTMTNVRPIHRLNYQLPVLRYFNRHYKKLSVCPSRRSDVIYSLSFHFFLGSLSSSFLFVFFLYLNTRDNIKCLIHRYVIRILTNNYTFSYSFFLFIPISLWLHLKTKFTKIKNPFKKRFNWN